MITDIKDLTSFRWATVTSISPLAIKLDGDTAALGITPDTLVNPAYLLVGDRVRVEMTQRKVIVHGRVSGEIDSNRGSTALRDATYGVPGSSVPAQVALANQKVAWYNTDLGWTETYFATTGSAGLTVKGLATGVASGWYPVSGVVPVCSVRRDTTTQALGSGSFITIQFNVEVVDTHGAWASGSPTRITAPVSGIYHLSGAGGINATTGRAGMMININGSNAFGNLVSASQEGGPSASNIWPMNAGDYAELVLYQETGAAQNTSGNGYGRPFLSASYLGPRLANV